MAAPSRRRFGFTLVELPAVSKVELPAVSRRKRLAFTLVELLVVITIIGMLVALLLPAINSARENARMAQCANNLQQLGKAMMSYGSARNKLPGYAQLVKRDRTTYVGGRYLPAEQGIVVQNVDADDIDLAWGVSWVAMLLPQIERQDIWDLLVNPLVDPNIAAADRQGILVIRPIESLVCPSDTDVTSQPDLPGLTYSANTGAWDRDDSFVFLYPPDQGDTTDNGVFMDLAAYQRNPTQFKPPQVRQGNIRDGAGTTIMLSENANKNYEPLGASTAHFTWLGGFADDGFGTEQQLGFVWVVNTEPQPGEDLDDQERINRNVADVVAFETAIPSFARPDSNHPGGVNVVFMDGHGQFLREDIDYIVYQQLLTSNGRKCVDPANWGNELMAPNGIIYQFRAAPPLSETDYQ